MGSNRETGPAGPRQGFPRPGFGFPAMESNSESRCNGRSAWAACPLLLITLVYG